MSFSYPSQCYPLMFWSKGHFLCFKGNFLLLQNNSSVLFSPTHSSSRALSHTLTVFVLSCLLLRGQRAPKSTGVALLPPESHPSPKPTCVAFADEGCSTCSSRQLLSARASPSLCRYPSQQNEVKPA